MTENVDRSLWSWLSYLDLSSVLFPENVLSNVKLCFISYQILMVNDDFMDRTDNFTAVGKLQIGSTMAKLLKPPYGADAFKRLHEFSYFAGNTSVDKKRHCSKTKNTKRNSFSFISKVFFQQTISVPKCCTGSPSLYECRQRIVFNKKANRKFSLALIMTRGSYPLPKKMKREIQFSRLCTKGN